MPPTLTAAEAAERTEPLLSVRDLSVVFELDEGTVRAVEGVSFEVRPGQVVGIVGESGCGKSVTMRAILQLIEHPGRITGGEILYRRSAAPPRVIDLARLPPRGRLMRALRGAEIALIPQEPMAAFSPVHTVGQQVIEAIMLHAQHRRSDGHAISRHQARAMEEGPVDDIFHAPKHPYTKALLRSIPSLYGETRIALPVIAGALPHPLNLPSGCPFHPR